LAIIAHPLHRYLRKRMGSDMGAALISVIVIALTVVLPLAFFLVSLTGELVGVFGNVRAYFDGRTPAQYLESILPESFHDQIPVLLTEFTSSLRRGTQACSSSIISIFSNAFQIFFGFLVVLIATYYLLKDGQKVKQELLALPPLGDEYDELV